jgi:hypothetical protein
MMRETLPVSATVKENLTVRRGSGASTVKRYLRVGRDQRRINAPSTVEAHFAASLASAIGETKAIAAAKKAKAPARKGKRDV